jgi:hypothetical protein
MGRRSRVAAFWLGCALLACGKSAQEAPQASAARSALAADAQAPSIYDAQGHLKPSAERVEWLVIPMGFRRKPSIDERHARFEADTLPLDKVREFLSARMFTGAVDETPARSAYHGVLPLENDPKAVRLDIVLTARPSQHSVVLEIERLTYGDAKPLGVDEARRVLARERSEAE